MPRSCRSRRGAMANAGDYAVDGVIPIEPSHDRQEITMYGRLFSLSSSGEHALFTRVQGTIVMDLNDVEKVTLDALGGADTITIHDPSGTSPASAGIYARVRCAKSGGGEKQADSCSRRQKVGAGDAREPANQR